MDRLYEWTGGYVIEKTSNSICNCRFERGGLFMGMKWRLMIELFKPRIGWESRKKIEEELTRLREQFSEHKGEFTKKEFEDMKKDLER